MSRTLADLYADDAIACQELCEAAALEHCSEACRQGIADSPFLRAVTVWQAIMDATANGRPVPHRIRSPHLYPRSPCPSPSPSPSPTP